MYLEIKQSRSPAQHPNGVTARRGAGGYSVIQPDMMGPRWQLHRAQRAAPSLNVETDACSSAVGGCSSGRVTLNIEAATGGLWVDGIRELDQFNALALLERVNTALTDKVKMIVIDLSQTVFLDSHGLGALIALRNKMGRRKGVVRLLNPSRLVEQVLELTRLHRVLDIVKCEKSMAG
jgi:anti-sigma B factor antagonist